MDDPATGADGGQRFFSDVRRLLHDRGWSARRAGLECGLGPVRIAYWLRTETYPIPRHISTIARGLGVSPENEQAWQIEAERYRRGGAKLIAALDAIAPPASPPPTFQRICITLTCLQPFTAYQPNQRFCSVWCKDVKQSKWENDNPLAVAFIARLRNERITTKEATEQSGISRGTLNDWLRLKGRILSRANLEKAATFLGMSFEEALALQGETAEEKQLRVVQEAKPWEEWTATYNTNSKKRRAWRKNLSKASKGKPKSDTMRQRLSAARKGMPIRNEHTKTPRWRALSTLHNLRRYHPELSRTEVEALAVARITRNLNLGSEAAARALLKRPARHAERKARRARKPLRCQLLTETYQARPRRENGERGYGFWALLAAKFRAAEGETKSKDQVREWAENHEALCPKNHEAPLEPAKEHHVMTLKVGG